MTEEVYLMTENGEYLQCINEDGFIITSPFPWDATPFYGPDEDNDLDCFEDGQWAYDGEPLTKLTQTQIDAIRGLCDTKLMTADDLSKALDQQTFMEKFKLYNVMFVSITGAIASDLPENEIKNHREEIKDWLTNELGVYCDAGHILNMPERCHIDTIELLDEIYKEAEKENE